MLFVLIKGLVDRSRTAANDASDYRLGVGIWMLRNAVDAITVTVGKDKRLDKLLATTEITERGVQVRRQMRLAK